MATLTEAMMFLDRTLPGTSGAQESGGIGSFNLIFIVGFAILITVLARYLSTRGRKGK